MITAAKELDGGVRGDYDEAISSFYGSYSPKKYHRGGNLYHGIQPNEITANIQGGSDMTYSVIVPITVSGDYMSQAGLSKNDDWAYIDDPGSVFDQSWQSGIHGNPAISQTDAPELEFSNKMVEEGERFRQSIIHNLNS